MKSLKAAAVIAGSLIAAGIGSPAFALGVGTTDLMSTNINGSETTIEPDGTVKSDELKPEDKNSMLHKVKGTAEGLKGTAEGVGTAEGLKGNMEGLKGDAEGQNTPPTLARIAGVSVPS
jgi:hypothetical protein